MKDKESEYVDLVQGILSGLAKVRMESDAWVDIESENQEKESQSFKIGECLRPFYLAARELPNQFSQLPLRHEILVKDTEQFFKLIQRDGFFPSPYSPIAEAKDQYTDFAAFALEFCAVANDYWKDKGKTGQRMTGYCKETVEKSLDFLLSAGNRLEDGQGCRWGGTNKYSRARRTTTVLYTNTVFTSIVLLSLHKILDDPILASNSNRQNEIRDTIRKAGKWIASRFDGGFITGDEDKTNRQLLNSTWGLIALGESYYTQEPAVRKIVPTVADTYLSALKTSLAEEQFLSRQEYLTIVSEDVDQPLYYEDRSGLGGILQALVSLRWLPDLEKLLEELNYNLIFEQISNSIMMLRNPRTGLWFNQGLILSIHSYLTEAFLKLSRRAREFPRKIEVSGHMIRSAVRQTLTDEAIITSLEQTVYQRLLGIIETLEKERVVQEGMSGLILPPPGGTKPMGKPKKAK
jgi:hypothetical protein